MLWRLMLVAMFMLLAGCGDTATPVDVPLDTSWQQIEQQSRGTTVRMMMWDGDPLINAYMRDFVGRALREKYDIQLELVGGQGSAIVNKLLVDLEAGRQQSDIDLGWINGENFYQLRTLDALYGPFTVRLPNSALIDWTNPFIAFDFQQPVEGFECPWGNVQQTLIYNAERVPQPPQTLNELAEWIRQHPGRFTFDNSFTGMTFLKSLLFELSGTGALLSGHFDEAEYEAHSEKLWAWLKDVRPNLWRQGKTFPESVAQLHQLLSNGEVDFSMSNNDGEVDGKVAQGILPRSSKAYVPQFGSIRNSHYLGIPVNASNKAAAMVVCNFLISPEAQLEKAKPSVWGDGTVLATSQMPEEWQVRFAHIDGRTRVASRDELQDRALMEPAPEIMMRLHEDFRRKIIERDQ